MTEKPFNNIHFLTEAQYEQETISDSDVYAVEMEEVELATNISSFSTDNQVPTAKAVYNSISGIEGYVQDVQIKGTSITASGVANIPQASSSVFGVIKANSNGGLSIGSNGFINVYKASDAYIEAKTDSYQPIVSSNLNKAVMEGLGNNSLTWSDAYKQSARNTIGAQETLASGTNIKTINTQSILGSGDITVSGEPSAYIKSASVSGNTLTLTKKDDTTVTYSSAIEVLVSSNL